MRRFFVGFLAVIGFVVLLMVALAAAAWFTLEQGEPRLAETAILELDFDEGLGKGATTHDPLARLFSEERLTLRDLLDALERGRSDPRIKGLFARIGEEFEVDIRGRRFPARIEKKPFYSPQPAA